MINKNRWLDLALFHVEKDIIVDETLIKSGWQQLVRKDNFYYFKKIKDNEFYAKMKISQNIVNVLFTKGFCDN